MNNTKMVINIISIVISLYAISQYIILQPLTAPTNKVERIKDYPEVERQLKENFSITDQVVIRGIIGNISEIKEK